MQASRLHAHGPSRGKPLWDNGMPHQQRCSRRAPRRKPPSRAARRCAQVAAHQAAARAAAEAKAHELREARLRAAEFEAAEARRAAAEAGKHAALRADRDEQVGSGDDVCICMCVLACVPACVRLLALARMPKRSCVHVSNWAFLCAFLVS
jgi:hypothetical protein